MMIKKLQTTQLNMDKCMFRVTRKRKKDKRFWIKVFDIPEIINWLIGKVSEQIAR